MPSRNPPRPMPRNVAAEIKGPERGAGIWSYFRRPRSETAKPTIMNCDAIIPNNGNASFVKMRVCSSALQVTQPSMNGENIGTNSCNLAAPSLLFGAATIRRKLCFEMGVCRSVNLLHGTHQSCPDEFSEKSERHSNAVHWDALSFHPD